MTNCRACARAITFVPTERGKMMPVNADGTSHFATCPQAERFRKPAPPQDVCLSCGSRDLDRLPGTGQHHAAIRCRHCGAHRWLRKPQETPA